MSLAAIVRNVAAAGFRIRTSFSESPCAPRRCQLEPRGAVRFENDQVNRKDPLGVLVDHAAGRNGHRFIRRRGFTDARHNKQEHRAWSFATPRI